MPAASPTAAQLTMPSFPHAHEIFVPPLTGDRIPRRSFSRQSITSSAGDPPSRLTPLLHRDSSPSVQERVGTRGRNKHLPTPPRRFSKGETVTAHKERMTSKQAWNLGLASLASYMMTLDSLVVTTTLHSIRQDLTVSIESLE